MRRLTILMVANLVLTLMVLGWLAWIVAAPRYWFEQAYKEPMPMAGPQGPKGSPGARGQRGPAGPSGPPGIDGVDGETYDDSELRSEIETVTFTVEDVESRSADVETRLDDLCTHDLLYAGAFDRTYKLSGC